MIELSVQLLGAASAKSEIPLLRILAFKINVEFPNCGYKSYQLCVCITSGARSLLLLLLFKYFY